MKRVLGLAIAVTLSAVWFSSTLAGRGQDAVAVEVQSAEKTADEKKQPEFPPEVQKALDEFLEKCVESRRDPARKEIKQVIESLTEFHKLDEDAVAKLEKLSDKAVDSSLKPWRENVKKFLRNAFEEQADGQEEKLAEALKEFLDEVGSAIPAEVVNEVPATGKARPDQQPEWQAVLKEVLTADQLAAWVQKEADEKAKLEQQFAKLIEITSDNYKRQYGSRMDPLAEDIIATTKLDEPRAKKLKEAAESAIDSFVTDWKAKAAEYLAGAEESQRESMLKRGYISFGVESESLPSKQKSWTEALDVILTKAEKEQWEKALADRAARRQKAARMMTISAIDELLALTAEQRKQLEPLMEEKVISALMSQLTRDYWGGISVPRIVQYTQTADQRKIEAILDNLQWERWQAAVKTKSRSQSAKPQEKKGAIQKPPPGPNPVAMETAITGHLYRLMLAERKKILSNILVRAEDAGRVVSLSPEARASLQTAAKGAAEEIILSWANSMNSWVRRSVKGATPANIDQRLESLGSVRFGRSQNVHDCEIWKNAVSTHLNEDQQGAWQVEINARSDYRSGALAALMMTQLDNAARLSDQQVGQLEPLLATAIDDYGPDIDRYFSSWSNDTPWYLNSYYNMIPFQGIPEEESKKILTEAQWKIWEERFENRVSHYWDQVLQYHEQRLAKEAKEKEAETEKAKAAEDLETSKES